MLVCVSPSQRDTNSLFFSCTPPPPFSCSFPIPPSTSFLSQLLWWVVRRRGLLSPLHGERERNSECKNSPLWMSLRYSTRTNPILLMNFVNKWFSWAMINTIKWETFEGEHLRKYQGFVTICKTFLCKVSECGILWQQQQAICESFLRENPFCKSFPLDSSNI